MRSSSASSPVGAPQTVGGGDFSVIGQLHDGVFEIRLLFQLGQGAVGREV